MQRLAPAVTAHEVEFRFGQDVALASASFSMPSGRVTAIIGPNGSGKSTVLNGIAGIKEAASGSLSVLGREPADAKHRVAYVLQASKVNEMMPVTVQEVVNMGRYASLGPFRRFKSDDRDRVHEAMLRMEITNIWHRHLHELSAGQRQRVFVAQGLAQDHDLLLLDEPLTGLDMISAETIDSVIHDEQRHGRTVVITTHDLAEARAADNVLLVAGRLVASGPPDEALTIENLAEAYGSAILHFGEGPLIDDPAHQVTDSRHVHLERGLEP